MRIKGNWETVDLSSGEPTYAPGSLVKEEWKFYNGGALTVIVTAINKDSVLYTVSNNGTYKFKAAKKIKLEGFTDPHLPYINTTWDIVDISKERLLLVNDQNGTLGLTFKELLRTKEE